MTDEHFTIGELAQRCGVATKTVRYYHEEGVLEPSATSESGYRLYTEEDAARLTLIRSLRVLGFSLDAIKQMLQDPHSARTLAQLQLHVVETQLRALARQQTILKRALELPDDTDVRTRLHFANAAATLGAAERQARIDAYLDGVQSKMNVEPQAREQLRSMLLLDLPEELNDAQLEAWIELSALLDDDSFAQIIRRQGDPFRDAPPEARETMGQEYGKLLSRALTALREDALPQSDVVRNLAAEFTELFARALGRENNAEFRRWFGEYAEQTNDPRIERFWQLVALLKGNPPPPPFHRAQALVFEALRTPS
ncbi:MAG: MerR family transcriptional regulator [Vulcanimicrobiaceae bacterium]